MATAETQAGPQASPSPTEPSLTGRVVKGAAWVFAGKLAGRGMSLVRLVVLARLLSPEDFGLFGIVMLAIATLETFTQTGFNTALIQRRDNTEDYLDTAWTVQIIRGFVLAGLLYASAPLVGWFFDEPRAIPLLRVMCISVAVGGFVNIGTIYFRKELRFHKQVIWDTASSFVGLVVGIVLAYQLRSVWALVWAGLAAAPVRVLLSYAIHPYHPRARFDASQANELFRFGKWMLGSSVVVLLATRLDHMMLGKVLGAGALGIYTIAYTISNMPATEITHLANAVMMPAYAKIGDDRRRLGNVFLQVFELVMSLAIPLTAFIILAAPQIVLGLLGSQWEAAVLPLRILALAGLLRSVNATSGPLFVGSGRPHMAFWINLSRAAVIAVATYPLTRLFGVPGAGVAVVLALGSTLPIWATVRQIGAVSWGAILRAMAQGFVLAGLVAVAVLSVRLLLPRVGPLCTLVMQGTAAAMVCGATVLLTGRWLNRGVSLYALKAWRSIRTA